MENRTEVLKAVISGNTAQLNEFLQSLNITERISVLAAQDYTDKVLEKKNVISIPCKTTPLIVAVQNGNLDCVKVLLNYKADIEAQGESFRYCQPADTFDWSRPIPVESFFPSTYTGPPLFVAAANGHLDILSYLFEQGANVNAFSCERVHCALFDGISPLLWYTPLTVALRNGHNDAFTFLIDKGADVNLQDHDGYTALHYAVESKNFDALSYLVYNRADVNLFTSSKDTPLMLACQSRNMETINFLLNKGADVNLQDRNGQSALHFASSDICYWLIQNLADVNMCDNHNCTPLMLASRNSDFKKVVMLIENGAKVDLQDVDGNTALHHAVNNPTLEYTTEICLALLTDKASNLCNSQGWTPLLLASKNCIESVVEKFLKQPEVAKEQKANALELLGASLCLKSGTFADVEEGFNYIRLGMKVRYTDNSHPLLKQQVEPVEAYQNRRECQTLEELAEIEGDKDAIIMESLVIRERIIGANNKELLKPIECVAEHFYSKDPGHFKRLSIPLYRYATKIAQGCIEEFFESAVSCL